MNHFLRLIKEGSITSAGELKRVFWRLALECHPDAGRAHASEEAFTRLRADYEEAAIALSLRDGPGAAGSRSSRESGNEASTRGRSSVGRRSSKPPGEAWDPRACVEAFADLVASNFPIDPSIDPQPRGYVAARKRFTRTFGRRNASSFRLFLDFERELYEIRGDNIVWNPLFGTIKLIMMNIPSCYYGNSFSRRAIARWLNVLEHIGEDEIELDAEAREAMAPYSAVVEFLSGMFNVALSAREQLGRRELW